MGKYFLFYSTMYPHHSDNLDLYLCAIHDDETHPKVGALLGRGINLCNTFIIDSVITRFSYILVSTIERYSDASFQYRLLTWDDHPNTKPAENKYCYVVPDFCPKGFTFDSNTNEEAREYVKKNFSTITSKCKKDISNLAYWYLNAYDNALIFTGNYGFYDYDYGRTLEGFYKREVIYKSDDATTKLHADTVRYSEDNLYRIHKYPLILGSGTTRYTDGNDPVRKLVLLENILPTSFADLCDKFKYDKDTILLFEYVPIKKHTSSVDIVKINVPVVVEIEHLLDITYKYVSYNKYLSNARKYLSVDMCDDPSIWMIDSGKLNNSYYYMAKNHWNNVSFKKLNGKTVSLDDIFSKR